MWVNGQVGEWVVTRWIEGSSVGYTMIPEYPQSSWYWPMSTRGLLVL